MHRLSEDSNLPEGSLVTKPPPCLVSTARSRSCAAQEGGRL